MQVTLVSPFDPFPEAAVDGDAHVGGVERVYAELAPRLVDCGHEVALVCSTDGPGGETEHRGVRVIRKPRATTVFRAPAARLHEAIPPSDVVQTPATYPLTTPAVLRKAEKASIASVLDFHFEPEPGSAVGRLAARIYREIGARVYPSADRVLASSKAYADRAPILSRVPPERVRVVPNGIDPDRFSPEGPTRSEGELLFVGRLVPYKGVDVLLRALSSQQDAPSLAIVGDGPMRSDLEAQADRLGVDATFLGRVDDDELAPLYRGAELTVLPSVNSQEAFGITLIESMACGTPVVASDLPGVADVAEHGGLVAPPRDPRALARRIDQALEADLDDGPALARRVSERFSWEAVAERTEAVYEELTDGSTVDIPEPPQMEVTFP